MSTSRHKRFSFFVITAFVLIISPMLVNCSGGENSDNNQTPPQTLSSAKAITAFSIASPQGTGIIDENAKTITLSVPYGTDVTALVALFTSTGASVTVNGTSQISGTTPNNFTSSVLYTVTAEDGSTAIYTVSVTIAAFVIPKPTGVSITTGDGYARISWNKITGLTDKAAGVAIAQKKGASGSYSIVGSVSIDQTTFIDTGLSPNTAYYYKLYTYTSYDAANISSYTSEYNVVTSTSNTIPSAPSNLTANAVDGWTIDLSWNDNSNNEDGFTIERSTDNVNFITITNTYANETSFRDNYVLATTPYYYRIKAFNVFGASIASIASVNTPSITPTSLGGGIAANTTLTLANSPYLVNSQYTLAPGYTLTIEPGVKLRFASSINMEVRGHLEAVGTVNNPIIFTAADPTNSSETSWQGIHVANNLGGNAIVQYAEMSHAAQGIWVDRDTGTGPVNIYDSIFNTNFRGVSSYSGYNFTVMIYRSVFLNNWVAVGDADKIIAYSKFQNNTYGLANTYYYPPIFYGTERLSVYYSLFTGNDTALWGGRGEVKYSVIQYNNIGVKPQYTTMNMLYNTITNNNTGVIASSYDTLTVPVQHNNIFNNTNYNIVNSDSSAVDATYNWWGTTSSAVIDSKIWDFSDDASLGIVNYAPVLTGPIDTIP